MLPTLYPEDAAYLARAVAEECSHHDVPYAARVGIAAVILNRIEDPAYPDTAAAVLSTWESPLFATIPTIPTPDPLTEDALQTALTGADPTGGALHFEFLDPTLINDSPFHTLVIDHIAFW